MKGCVKLAIGKNLYFCRLFRGLVQDNSLLAVAKHRLWKPPHIET